jgi:predicted permease
MRLFILPALALGVILLLGVGETLVRVVTLFVAMPTATLLPAYPMRSRPGEDGELMAGLCGSQRSVLCIYTICCTRAPALTF